MSESLIDATCGAISGIMANLFTHPLDTIKCRMQTDPIKYNSTIKTTFLIMKNEKIMGFYKGIFANTLMSVPINSGQFMIFGKTKRYLKEKNYITNKHLIDFISGSSAGLYK